MIYDIIYPKVLSVWGQEILFLFSFFAPTNWPG